MGSCNMPPERRRLQALPSRFSLIVNTPRCSLSVFTGTDVSCVLFYKFVLLNIDLTQLSTITLANINLKATAQMKNLEHLGGYTCAPTPILLPAHSRHILLVRCIMCLYAGGGERRFGCGCLCCVGVCVWVQV